MILNRQKWIKNFKTKTTLMLFWLSGVWNGITSVKCYSLRYKSYNHHLECLNLVKICKEEGRILSWVLKGKVFTGNQYSHDDNWERRQVYNKKVI